MKKLLIAGAFALALLVVPTAGSAHQYDRDDSDHPLRYVAYVVHPIGIAIEYALLRPIHYMVSQPNMSIIFGHQPCEDEDHDYFEWE